MNNTTAAGFPPRCPALKHYHLFHTLCTPNDYNYTLATKILPSLHPIRCFQTATVSSQGRVRKIGIIDHPAESRQDFAPLQRQSVLLPPLGMAEPSAFIST
jgi:hypothetical protein